MKSAAEGHASGLESKRIVAELVALAREFSIEVTMDAGDFSTSLCRLKGQTLIYVNTNESVNRIAEVIGDALSGKDLDAHYLLPEVRALLEGTEAFNPVSAADPS